jgi:hypothetical protein
MKKIILSNGFFYSGEIIKETDKHIIFKDKINKILQIRKDAIIIEELEVFEDAI